MSKTFIPTNGQTSQGEPVSLTTLLQTFRQQLETEAEVPINALELNAGLLLYDLCNCAGLSAHSRAQVLGQAAAAETQIMVEGIAPFEKPGKTDEQPGCLH